MGIVLICSTDSASTNNPVLRFMLYVPSPKHRPLRLAVPGELNTTFGVSNQLIDL